MAFPFLFVSLFQPFGIPALDLIIQPAFLTSALLLIGSTRPGRRTAASAPAIAR